MDEMLKSGYQNFLDKMAHDSIWNAKKIFIKYGKTHRARDATFKDAILRAELFTERLQPFTKSRNRFGSVGWWRSMKGIAEEASQKRHLIALPDTTKVLPLDICYRKGGYATVRRVHIEGAPVIEPW
jgi:hypothetical protein